MSTSPSFVLGVNYWPRKKAMYWWKDFDKNEVEKEFAEIKALKLHVVRIFLFWEDFQPAFDRINDEALQNLGTVLDTAQEAGLHVMPTFFTGHMSGINWWPEWALTDQEAVPTASTKPGDLSLLVKISNGKQTYRVGRDVYADPLMLDAEQRLITAVCQKFGEHSAIYSWNFANEPDIFCIPQTYEDSANWNKLLTETVRKYSSRPVSAGVHLYTIDRYNGFRPDMLAPFEDFLSMHAYSIYYRLTAETDPMNSDVVPIANLVTESLGGKPVLFEEFGYASSEKGDKSEFQEVSLGSYKAKQYFADDTAGGNYYAEVLEKLARVGSLGAFGWMFSDYDPSLWDKPPFDRLVHERFFGLTRIDGSVKPSGEAMKNFAEKIAAGQTPNRTVQRLPLNPDEYYKNPQESFDAVFTKLKGTI